MDEVYKALSKLDIDAVILTVDDKNGFAEIEGTKNLKDALFEVSSHILKRRHILKADLPEDLKLPEGATKKLPPLPPKGIDGLTYTQLGVYWGAVMSVVCSDRGARMRYGTKR